MRLIVRPRLPSKSRDFAGHQPRQCSEDAPEQATDSTRLVERMTLSRDQHFGIPVVAVEETMRGWLAAIAKERLVRRQVAAYRELSSLFEFFATFLIAPFDQAAADLFDSLRDGISQREGLRRLYRRSRTMKPIDVYHRWVEWSDEDHVYIGKYPDLITEIHGNDPVEVFKDLHEVLQEVVDYLAQTGRSLPPPRTRPMMEVS